jgi:hypothetical protein
VFGTIPADSGYLAMQDFAYPAMQGSIDPGISGYSKIRPVDIDVR